MESAEKELINVLLDHIRFLGLISDSTYSGAVDLVHSVMDFPPLFRYPVSLPEEVTVYEHHQNTQ